MANITTPGQPNRSCARARARARAAQQRNGHFPLHRLPVEIRLMIYDLAFISPHPIRPHHIHDRGVHTPRHEPHRHILPPGTMEMLLLNRVISAEIRQVLYTKNTFHLVTRYHRDWLGAIGRPNARCLRSLVIDCGSKRADRCLRDLAAFQNTLAKWVPCLTDVRYLVEDVNEMHGDCFGAGLLLRAPVAWKRWRFLEEITVVMGYPKHYEGHRLTSWFWRDLRRQSDGVVVAGHMELVDKLANAAGVPVRLGLLRRCGETYEEWVKWVVDGKPEEPRPKPAVPPAMGMGGDARHALWNRKMERKQRARTEKKRVRLEKEKRRLEEEKLRWLKEDARNRPW